MVRDASVFRCRECHSYWVEAFEDHPHIYLEPKVKAEFPELFEGLERPDDGQPWVG